MKSLGALSKGLVVLGTIVLLPALVWLLAGVAGVVPMDAAAVPGYSGPRVIGSFAVAGCLLAAIGSWDR